MIRLCDREDQQAIYEIINDASRAYKGVIPDDRYHEPYMAEEELSREIEDGVVFWGFEEEGQMIGVMGIQDKGDVSLIRHAYVRTTQRNGGIGTKLLHHLIAQTKRPVLIGTWKTAEWAIRFYEKNGFRCVSTAEKEQLLRQFWNVPERQIETSVVLCDSRWTAGKFIIG
ncbi:GNAT family N-acetyltransferase [Paenibacillus sp. HJL G12]|uniref:GNAT family N-acetyltransferase n=1 Tax=Paenibacillus dendrobii TaxID=2691084 RepID=A0A7X3LH91_9BACL|nr:GNAT family N-acetyltransferase [Paenibacillus dendrobii]MWV43313.1 GNAT family N-acetyltransferase [Paenibacillus dendrobii]